jgi:[protein-PII] uridylyltransferase
MGEEEASRLVAAEESLRAALDREDPKEVERFLERMPRGYLLSVPPELAARHFPQVSAPIGATEIRTVSGRGELDGTYALTVIARDRPGLLSRTAGALSLSGLSILTAQVFTTEDGLAVDLFEVQGAFEREVGEERWRRFRNTLRKALEDRLSLEHGVRERRSHYPPPRVEFPLKITVDDEASDFFTVIEVSATDRIGLLYDVTQALFEQGLDVHLAKVATYGGRVVDAFYVRDALGRKLDDPAAIGPLTKAIEAALA